LLCRYIKLGDGELDGVYGLLRCWYSKLGGMEFAFKEMEVYGKCSRLKGNAKDEVPTNDAARGFQSVVVSN